LLDQSFHWFQEVWEVNVVSCFRLVCLSFSNVSKKLFFYGRSSWIHVIVSEMAFVRLHVVGGTRINIKITSTLGFNWHEFKYLQQHQWRLFGALKYLQFLVFDAVISFSTWSNLFFKMTSRANTGIVAEFVSVASG
jgi:hypothetical protein